MKREIQFNRVLVVLAAAFIALSVFGIWILWWRLNPANETIQVLRQNEETRAQLVKEVAETVVSLGRTPETQQELEDILAHKLPHVMQRGQLIPIRYHRISNTHYILQHILLESDDLVFDSSEGDLGWTKRNY